MAPSRGLYLRIQHRTPGLPAVMPEPFAPGRSIVRKASNPRDKSAIEFAASMRADAAATTEEAGHFPTRACVVVVFFLPRSFLRLGILFLPEHSGGSHLKNPSARVKLWEEKLVLEWLYLGSRSRTVQLEGLHQWFFTKEACFQKLGLTEKVIHDWCRAQIVHATTPSASCKPITTVMNNTNESNDLRTHARSRRSPYIFPWATSTPRTTTEAL